MSVFALRLPDDLKAEAAAQAEKVGLSLNQYIASALSARVGAQAEAERYFALRGARAVPGEAMEILNRAGIYNPPREDDLID
ncbi:MAG TPA: toxin-antitoxin system HicB family antitoxin [Rhodospirillaceae bacterium]|nr:toxin-antitoxin system HicB family antitoxin [Rhodospirillaceae bacterium]